MACQSRYDYCKNNFTTAVVDGIIYAIGGKDGNNNRLNSVEAYDPVANTWTQKDNIPTARYGLTCSVVNGKIFVMGGNSGDSTPCSDRVEEYNPATNTWTSKAVMIAGRNYLSSAAVNNKIYAIGGNNDAGVCCTVEEYTP
jgi:N-acetylneuraminic acid mutarotase